MNRRKFLGITGGVVGGVCLSGCESMNNMIWGNWMPFKISLAQWSLNNRLFGRVQPTLDNLDFAQEAKRLGFDAVEYVNQFFMDKATDKAYINEMKKRLTVMTRLLSARSSNDRTFGSRADSFAVA